MDAISNFASRLSRKSQTKEEWLDDQVRTHRFVVLLFYRGKWGVSMWEYLTAFVPYIQHLRARGGELFVVVPKRKNERKKMEKHFDSLFRVVGDPDNHLADKFHITVRKQESKFSLLHSASMPIDRRHSMSLHPMSVGNEMFHTAHPGVLVISGVTSKRGEWTTKRTIKNHYEHEEHFTPVGLRDLLDLHFGRARRI